MNWFNKLAALSSAGPSATTPTTMSVVPESQEISPSTPSTPRSLDVNVPFKIRRRKNEKGLFRKHVIKDPKLMQGLMG
jgi:hypothetical protein